MISRKTNDKNDLMLKDWKVTKEKRRPTYPQYDRNMHPIRKYFVTASNCIFHRDLDNDITSISLLVLITLFYAHDRVQLRLIKDAGTIEVSRKKKPDARRVFSI